jgi:hypothetical protein
MVYFKDSQTWLQQSTLLLEARPTTVSLFTSTNLLPLLPSPHPLIPLLSPHILPLTQRR